MTYQENILPDINAEDGHNVIIVSNAAKYENGEIVETEEEDKVLPNGVRLIRYKYDFIGTKLITAKIQKTKKIKKLMEEFAPDSIMYHGVCGYELVDVANYIKKHPKVLFYIDSHEDYRNTARNKLSKFVYKYIHGIFVKKALTYTNKILYICEDSRNYLKDMYHIEDVQMEFYPLGGVVSSEIEIQKSREELIEKYQLPKECVIFAHSGKMDKLKKTPELLRAFSKIESTNVVMIIVGSISVEMEKEIKQLIDNDERVFFLGWRSGQELIEVLRAADIYCQPGSPSATSQIALCCGCAEIVYPLEVYKIMYEENVLYAENEDELYEVMSQLIKKDNLNTYKSRAMMCAKEKYDYKKLANRYLM